MPRKQPGKFMKGGHAVIILRSGQVITKARITEKSMRVATSDLGTLTFKLEQISTIVYKNLPNFPTDLLRTVGGSEINGEVLNDPVHVEAEDLGGAAEIARARIINITF